MTNPFFQLGAAFAGLVVIAIAALEGKEIAQSVGLVEEDEPVLVFEIRHPQNLASVRNAIADDRVVEEREERLAKLQSLVHKPTLSRGEQLFVLKAMNDGI